jgi:hypothetical protein
MIAPAENVRVLSLVPGRMRLHLPGWAAAEACQIETGLCRVKGVKSVQANPLTGNVLIQFDRSTTDEQRLLAGLQKALAERPGARPLKSAARDGMRPVAGQGVSRSSLLRVGVRGVLGHAAVDSLWFTAGFLGESIGLPLAGLGPVHVVMDIAVWGMALASGTPHHRSEVPGKRPSPAFHQRAGPSPRTPGNASGGQASGC